MSTIRHTRTCHHEPRLTDERETPIATEADENANVNSAIAIMKPGTNKIAACLKQKSKTKRMEKKKDEIFESTDDESAIQPLQKWNPVGKNTPSLYYRIANNRHQLKLQEILSVHFKKVIHRIDLELVSQSKTGLEIGQAQFRNKNRGNVC